MIVNLNSRYLASCLPIQTSSRDGECDSDVVLVAEEETASPVMEVSGSSVTPKSCIYVSYDDA